MKKYFNWNERHFKQAVDFLKTVPNPEVPDLDMYDYCMSQQYTSVEIIHLANKLKNDKNERTNNQHST